MALKMGVHWMDKRLSLRTKFTQGRTIKAKNNCNQAQVAPCIHEFLMAILNIEQPAT